MTGFTLGQLAEALDAKLDGDATRVVTGVAPLDSAGASDISFLTNPRYEPAARASRAGAFIAPVGTRGWAAVVARIDTVRFGVVPVQPLQNIATSSFVSRPFTPGTNVCASHVVVVTPTPTCVPPQPP